MKELARFITDERTGLKYELCGDYYIIAGEDEPEHEPIGVWGHRHLNYIKKHCKPFYNKLRNEQYEDFYESYPFKEPKVYLDGTCEDYFPQVPFSCGDDSVVLVRDKRVVEYTKSSFAELLAKDKDGNLIWVDGRTAPYAGC